VTVGRGPLCLVEKIEAPIRDPRDRRLSLVAGPPSLVLFGVTVASWKELLADVEGALATARKAS
jgi:hypothetical protein